MPNTPILNLELSTILQTIPRYLRTFAISSRSTAYAKMNSLTMVIFLISFMLEYQTDWFQILSSRKTTSAVQDIEKTPLLLEIGASMSI